MTQQFIGTKIVTAWPSPKTGRVRICGIDCKRGDEHCNNYCHDASVKSPPPAPDEPGYGVKYADGYTSWSPKEAFEAAYLPLGHIDHLPDWHQRLIGEHAELRDRMGRLDKFMDSEAFKTMSQEHGYLLQRQLETMYHYLGVLEQRLSLLPQPVPVQES